jgi:hypothetical protein
MDPNVECGPDYPEIFYIEEPALQLSELNPIHEDHKRSRCNDDKQEGTVGMFGNRLIVCLFAVCLLWLTSLQVCVAIVGFNISVPSFTSTATSCNYAYSKVADEKESYATCARRQTSQCRVQLGDSYLQEKMRLAAAQQANQLFATAFSALTANYTTAVTLSKEAISAWQSAGMEQTIPYRSSCSVQDRKKVIQELGDNTDSRSSVFAASLAYTQSSDSTIERLADYSVALSVYNADYLHNKTNSLQRLAESVVLDVSVPHMQTISLSFDPVFSGLNTVVACLSLSNRSSTCPYPNNLLAKYSMQAFASMASISRLIDLVSYTQLKFSTLVQRMQWAVAAADAFYDSVQGAQGIVKWVLANSGLSNLCGKSSPNFCSFSKVTHMARYLLTVLPPLLVYSHYAADLTCR